MSENTIGSEEDGSLFKRLTEEEIAEHFRKFSKHGSKLEQLRTSLNEKLERMSLTRHVFQQKETEPEHAVAVEYVKNIPIRTYMNMTSHVDVMEAVFNDVLEWLLRNEEQFLTSVASKADKACFISFPAMFRYVQESKQHHAHLLGNVVWHELTAHSEAHTYYQPYEKHHTVLDGVLGYLLFDGCPAPILCDMFRTPQYPKPLERNTWLHIRKPCGVYFTKPVTVELSNAGGSLGVLVRHTFTCEMHDMSGVSKYYLTQLPTEKSKGN